MLQPFIVESTAEVAELCRTHHVRRLSIFGSAVRDDFDPATSDVDVRVEFADEAFENYVRTIHSLQDRLSNLLGRKVDMLTAQEIPNPYLRKIIEESQVTLYAA